MKEGRIAIQLVQRERQAEQPKKGFICPLCREVIQKKEARVVARNEAEVFLTKTQAAYKKAEVSTEVLKAAEKLITLVRGRIQAICIGCSKRVEDLMGHHEATLSYEWLMRRIADKKKEKAATFFANRPYIKE